MLTIPDSAVKGRKAIALCKPVIGDIRAPARALSVLRRRLWAVFRSKTSPRRLSCGLPGDHRDRIAQDAPGRFFGASASRRRPGPKIRVSPPGLHQSKQRKMTKRSLFIEKGRFTGSLLECARITDMNFGGTALMGLMMAPPRPPPQMSSVPRAPDADKTGG